MQTISKQAIEEQFEQIATLLDEQEAVIVRLDELNDSIESLIEELAEERKAKQDAASGEINSSNCLLYTSDAADE